MRFRKVLAGAFSVMLATTAVAHTGITQTSPIGYLSRGIQMYENGNYEGTIDQLSHLRDMEISDGERETADFLLAKSYFNVGNSETALRLLNRFIIDYPGSYNLPAVQAAIGDVYFYNGLYADAITAYRKVDISALPTRQKEDAVYRLAYSELRLKTGDVVHGKVVTENDIPGYRAQAMDYFKSLSGTLRYRDAAKFYNAYLDYEKGDCDKALDGFSSINKRGELGYNAQYYMCQIYYMKKDLAKVTSIGTELLNDGKSSEMDVETSRIVGESYFRKNEDANAIKYIQSYLATADTEPTITARYILGVLNYRNHDYQAALEQLSTVSQEDNTLGQSAYYYLGHTYRKQQNSTMAALSFEKAAKQNHSKAVQEAALYNYAVIQNEGGRTPFSNAIGMFEDFLAKFPDSRYADDVREYMASLYESGKDYSKALQSISRIQSPSSKVLAAKQTVLYNLGVNELSNGNVREAQKHLLQARSLAKHDRKLDAQNSLWLGECAFRSGDYSQAAKYQNEYLKAVDSDDKNYGLGYYNLGYSRFMLKDYAKARNAFVKAISSKRLNATMTDDANNRIGDTYYYSKDFKTAQKYYAESSGDYSIYQKGMMLGLEKDYSGKVAQMKSLVSRYPSSALVPMALLEEADAYVSMNNNKKAVAVYDELISKYPDNVYARKGLLNKAITLRNAKDEDGAIAAYKEVVRKYPTSEEAGIAMEDMKLIFAEKGELDKLAKFVASIDNAPELKINDMDRLAFEAAEKAYIADNEDISRMQNYLKSNSDGAYTANAKYYIAKYNYNKGRDAEALELLNEVEALREDASFMEDVLAMKASILDKQGKPQEALETYRKLESKASNADNRLTARLGMMRTSVKLGDNKTVQESATALLNDGGMTPEEEKEVRFCRAYAYYKQGKPDSAKKEFLKLSSDTRNLYGAQSAYYVAEIQYESGDFKDAENTLNTFIDAGTPHQYWLARSFILLADVYYKRGDVFEACEYLESLKSNYPGTEKDIFSEIEERLSKWKTETKKK